jgi:hypothetical protein
VKLYTSLFESEKKQEEIRKLVDSVAKTERDRRMKTKSKARRSGQAVIWQQYRLVEGRLWRPPHGRPAQRISSFGVKSRPARPVCQHETRKFTIMRMAHALQECVEGQMFSRSRKCPTCNNKFSGEGCRDFGSADTGLFILVQG